jgi:hypothetical protein
MYSKEPKEESEKKVWIWCACVAQKTRYKPCFHDEKLFRQAILNCLTSKDDSLRFAVRFKRESFLISISLIEKFNLID